MPTDRDEKDAARIRIEGDHREIRLLCDSTLARAPATIENVAAGLGTRRFYRLFFEGGFPRSVIARVEDAAPGLGSEAKSQIPAGKPSATPPAENRALAHPIAAAVAPTWLAEPSLEPIRRFLEEGGLPVPKSYGRDVEQGIDLLEDVGARTLKNATGTERDRLYAHACRLLPPLQSLVARPDQVPAFGRLYDRALIESKFWKFEHWTIPGLLGREANLHEREAMADLTETLSILSENAPRRLAHRDFKAENLHWIPTDANGEREDERLVMIDVQGAFMAPPEYDLVCLLYDLQVDLDEARAQSLFEQTLAHLPDASSRTESARRFDLLAIARLCKDVSHVVEAGLVRGDRRRWHEIPRGLDLLARALNREMGRKGHGSSYLSALTSVMSALSEAARSSDSRQAPPNAFQEQT